MEARNLTVVRAVYRFLREHSSFLEALVKSSSQGDSQLAHSLDGYFTPAERRVLLFCQRPAAGHDIPPHLFMRYTFGMVPSAVLVNRWLFPDGQLDDAVAAAALSRIAFKAMQRLPAAAEE